VKPATRFFGLLFLSLTLFIFSQVDARPPIRRAFFNVYPSAEGTQLDDLPSHSKHCGVCHFNFDGGGPRNAYGLEVQVAINSGMYATDEDAIASVEGVDADGDGYVSLIEITDVSNFSNTPTFPGLSSANYQLVSNVDTLDILDYLTPSGGTDTIPPTVMVTSPNGGEVYGAGDTPNVTWTAFDASGISHVTLYMSDDNGSSYAPVALNEDNDGSYGWFVPNLPGTQTLIRVVATDSSGNDGLDDSDSPFEITAQTGRAPTTLRDMKLAGTQPLVTGVTLSDPDANCKTCHGNYDPTVEPWYIWKGSMMAQAMRDPLFQACLAVAEQDAPSVGDLCIRCHTPGGWLEGRSVDTGGGLITAKDRQGVQCDFCHRLVDPVYAPGVSPTEDQDILNALDNVPLTTNNGEFITDPGPGKRGPFDDAVASHQFIESPFHVEGDVCGTCHDVSNPVFLAGATPGDYVLSTFDQEHPDFDLRNMFPIERTYSEWSVSEYAVSGVYAPQFAGNKASGIVSTCQDCHMADVSGIGCNEPGVPTRENLPLHDLTGGNTFIPDILPDFYASEVDTGRLQAGKQRAISMLQKAASLELTPGQDGPNPTVTVKVTNETGHKFPSGYPEGRRIWINVKAWNAEDSLVYESGEYDASTGVLDHDEDLKLYEIEPGLSPGLAPVVGLPAGPSFHFVLNDSVYFDNRIPPRGFTNAAFEAIQSAPVGYSYADSQYWDETEYILHEDARFVEVTVYYQTTSKEYIEFLRDENTTNTAGLDLYNAWVAQGKSPPVAMVSDTTSVEVTPTFAGDDVPAYRTALYPNEPNPFNPGTLVRYSLKRKSPVSVRVYDVRGSLVRTLIDGVRPAGMHEVMWNGRNGEGRAVSSGVYFLRMETPDYRFTRKAILLK
jgi:hypothetical protein